MGFGAFIIGDEIIRGKREDKHFTQLIAMLRQRGLRLSRASYLADNPDLLADEFRRSFATDDVVFSFGGIGATPDDHTRLAVARAAGVELQTHPEGLAEIRAKYGDLINTNRLQLVDFPAGSRIIPNPFNRVPGFSWRDHHFVPGFPQMAWPMVEWVLETYYRARFHTQAEAEQSIIVWEGNEGALIDLMRRIEADYPGVTVSSLPAFATETMRRHVELGVRGDPARVGAAMMEMRAEVLALGLEIGEI